MDLDEDQLSDTSAFDGKLAAESVSPKSQKIRREKQMLAETQDNL